MQSMRVQAGATIFHSGDPSVAVYVVTEGEVAITAEDAHGGKHVVRLGAGELFGESGVLEGRCRAATATATTATTLLVTDAEAFFSAFGMNNDRALVLVKLLCRRLRETSLRTVLFDPPQVAPPEPPRPRQPDASYPTSLTMSRSLKSGGARAHPSSVAGNEAIRLLPNRGRLVTQFHMGPIDVQHLPFQVGNSFGGGAARPVPPWNCGIAAPGEVDLSAPHFEILRRNGELGVRDLHSRFGTIVNGTAISGDSQDVFARLHVGANDVVAGRLNSPFRFVYKCESPEHASGWPITAATRACCSELVLNSSKGLWATPSTDRMRST